MKDDPEFDAFWAVYPRKDRKPEARYEWWQALRRFSADEVILAAAYYCGAARGKPHDRIFTAATWLKGLERPAAPEQIRQPGIFGLDLTSLGEVLLTTCVLSRQLGHSSARCTVRDYVEPHGPYDAETNFVNDAIMGRNPEDMISIEEVTEWMGRIDWIEPGVA